MQPLELFRAFCARARALVRRGAVVRIAALAASVAAWVAPVHAQGRSLHWRSVDVDARLDRDGVLHVTETQRMVFTGDWNGGERRFTVALGQDFDFERMVRVDSATGSEVTMIGGDLDRVDGFDFAGSNVVRWRSRLATDPPFAEAERTYRLEYSYRNIVVPEGDRFHLDHDFAFHDRDGPIEAFTLDLTLDPAWEAPPGFAGHFGPESLDPGYGYVVDLPLRYLPAGRPAGVLFGAGEAERWALMAAVLLGILLFGGRMFGREAALGRFASSAPLGPITNDWLQQRVFAHRPEVIGAAWDEATGAAEVTAVLARLEGEGKLTSRVESKKILVFTQHVLHMELLVDRNVLQGYERALIDALFDAGKTKTDTNAIRKRYESRGFTPSTKIEGSLKGMVHALVPDDPPPRRPGKQVTASLLAAGIATLVAGCVLRPADIPVAVIGAFATLGAYLFTLLQARLWQERVNGALVHSLRFLVPVLAMFVGYTLVVREEHLRTGAVVLAGLGLLLLAATSSIFAMAMWRRGPKRLRLRRELAAARRYFTAQLKQPQPQLRDEWFPYLIAFGLGSHMDHWFKAFGGASRSTSSIGSGSSWASSGSGGGGSEAGGWSGLGGGGGFAGGGSSGAWVAAASSVASGVSAPSSSGSSGGGSSSGGSSSGGGGGGGW